MTASLPTVVFAGDSITDAGRDPASGSLGTGYVAKLAKGPLAFARVVNAGVSGDRMADLEARFNADVLAEQPVLVSIFIGINDTWQVVTGEAASPLKEFEAAYRRLIESLGRTPVVLVVPFVAPVTPDQEGWGADLELRQELVHHLAAEYGCAVVDLGLMIREYSSDYENEELAGDGVHPTDLGHKLIAEAWNREAHTRVEALRRP